MIPSLDTSVADTRSVEVLICSDRYTGEGSYKFNHMKGVFGARGRIWI